MGIHPYIENRRKNMCQLSHYGGAQPISQILVQYMPIKISHFSSIEQPFLRVPSSLFPFCFPSDFLFHFSYSIQHCHHAFYSHWRTVGRDRSMKQRILELVSKLTEAKNNSKLTFTWVKTHYFSILVKRCYLIRCH